MWHIYISFAVLFRGAYCIPLINTAEHSNCTVVIKRFGEQVKTLEVKWNSTIDLICEASCVGPRPQLRLTWFYRDKNQSKLINLKKLFPSPKFETYTTKFRRVNELVVIRDFGPNEETNFICRGSIKTQRLEAKVALIGTDCLLKYNFRCKLGNKCIDRAYLCNHHNECPNGEDEVGCGSVQTDGILTIPDIQPSYAGNYMYTGTTDTGKTGSAVTRQDVEVKPATERPTVHVEPYKITVSMGTTGTLRCIVTGVPAPTITWLKSRQELSTNHQIDGDILRITQATMEDRGIYVCSAENVAGSDQDWGIVEVERRMRPKIDLYPEGTQTVSVGGSALFQCRVINGYPPPKVTWSRVGGLQLTERTEVKENGVIMFKGTTQQEQGSYICTATNDMGTTTATATLIVQVEEGQRVKVKIAGPGTLSVVDGGSVELTCTASAILNPLIRWRRREGPLPPGHSLRGGILSIPRLTVEYGGEYICSTFSPEGSYQASVFIIVTVSPRLIVSPSRLVARAGENIILRCSLTGSRPFNIEWSKVDGVLSPRALKNEGVMEIQQVTAADAGRYRCVATSASDSSEGYAVVEITVPPTIVIQPSKTINAIVGQRVRMECIAQGEPIPTVYWINPLVPRLGNIVPKAGFPQTKGTAILDITNVGKENKGYYTCAAQNAGGRTEDKVQLIVEEGQRAEVKISGPGTLSVVDGGSVELTCTASAILNPLIRWRHREGPLPPGHSMRGGILSIPRLTVEYGGEYICSTSSPEGSYQASMFIIVTGAYCIPLINTAEPSNCTVVIKRFGEQVTTLEVKWHSTIHLICDASCVGPGPQPGLTWFYRDKNQSKPINIERLFRSQKFETYPTNFHRKNELVIRDFGPNEVTDFVCKGAIKKQRHEAKVALNGTDCLLKYNFRCKSGNKCIDRAYLCNQHNECPDGEDEVGCGNDMNTTTTVASIRIPEKGVVIEKTSDETTCRGDQFQCADGNCVEARMKCDGTPQCVDGSDERNCPSCPPNSFQCETTSQLECVDVSLVCDRFPDCTDRSDEVGCPSCRKDQFNCTDGNCVEGNMRCDGTAQCEDRSDEIGCPKCRGDQFQCAAGNCVEARMKCDGTPQCEDGSDELNCPSCPPNNFQCETTSQLECVDASLVCNRFPDCTDRSDEVGCPSCRIDQFNCTDGNCVEGNMRCDGIAQCEDKSDEIECPTVVCLSDEFRCVNQQKCVSIAFRCNGIRDCEDGSDEADCVVTAAPPAVCTADQYKCSSGECVDGRNRCDGQQDCYDGSDEENCPKSCEFQCKNGTCISSTKKCDGIPDCPDGDDEICEIPLICPEGKKGCKDLSKCIDDSQFCNGVRDCTDGGDEKDCGLEKEKIIDAIARINDDGDNGPLSTTDGVTDNTGEFTDSTPFDYELYAN